LGLAEFLLFAARNQAEGHDHFIVKMKCSNMPPRSIRVLHLSAVLSIAAVPPGMAVAELPSQRQALTGAYRQIEAIERQIERSSVDVTVVPGDRYHLDYARLLADLARVRAGIDHYLTPTRAQPRDLDELSGQYRKEALSGQPPVSEADQ